MTIEIQRGDITKIEADAIVNAANNSLLGGGGVDGAIHKAAGKELLEACIEVRNRQGGCKVGEAVITIAGNLNAKHVIHTVGPKWNQGKSNEAQKLQNCYLNSLKLAETHQLNSIVFPNISTGIYGYPKDQAAKIAFETVAKYQSSSIQKVIFCCFDAENFRLYGLQMKS